MSQMKLPQASIPNVNPCIFSSYFIPGLCKLLVYTRQTKSTKTGSNKNTYIYAHNMLLYSFHQSNFTHEALVNSRISEDLSKVSCSETKLQTTWLQSELNHIAIQEGKVFITVAHKQQFLYFPTKMTPQNTPDSQTFNLPSLNNMQNTSCFIF